MKIHAVVNTRAGTVLDRDSGPLKGQIRAAFRAQGHEVTLHLISPDDLVAAAVYHPAQRFEGSRFSHGKPH